MTEVYEEPLAFEWDKGNSGKNFGKHRVTDRECEEVFFDGEKKILKHVLHAGSEPRYLILGKTKENRLLFLVFTIRSKSIRVISARDPSKKERKVYHHGEKT